MKNNKLKRTLAIALSIAFASTVFAQAIKDSSKDFTINGIHAKEDIGGVEVTLVEVKKTYTSTHDWTVTEYSNYRVAFENYNDFTVTVTYEFIGLEYCYLEIDSKNLFKLTSLDTTRVELIYAAYTGDVPKESGTIFLRAGESKQIGKDYCDVSKLKMIVRKMAPKD